MFDIYRQLQPSSAERISEKFLIGGYNRTLTSIHINRRDPQLRGEFPPDKPRVFFIKECRHNPDSDHRKTKTMHTASTDAQSLEHAYFEF
jgi:hypothetical protein